MRKVAQVCSLITEHEIIGVLVMKQLVEDEEDFNEKVAFFMSSTSHSKAAKIEGILRAFNDNTRVIGAAGALIAETRRRVIPSPSAEELNRFLVRDGYQYDPRTEQVVPTVGQPEEEAEIKAELESRLRMLDNRFVEMHEGIWDAISSGGADSLRQAISSSRELLRQVIDYLVGVAEPGLTRKARVKRILGSSTEAELADAAATLVDAIYASQSAEEHTDPGLDSTIYVAKMTQYSLLFVLRKVQGRLR